MKVSYEFESPLNTDETAIWPWFILSMIHSCFIRRSPPIRNPQKSLADIHSRGLRWTLAKHCNIPGQPNTAILQAITLRGSLSRIKANLKTTPGGTQFTHNLLPRNPEVRSCRPLTNPFSASESPTESHLNRWSSRAPQGTSIIAARRYLFCQLQVKFRIANGVHLFQRYSRLLPFEGRPVKRSGQASLVSVSAKWWSGGQARALGLGTFGATEVLVDRCGTSANCATPPHLIQKRTR